MFCPALHLKISGMSAVPRQEVEKSLRKNSNSDHSSSQAQIICTIPFCSGQDTEVPKMTRRGTHTHTQNSGFGASSGRTDMSLGVTHRREIYCLEWELKRCSMYYLLI